MVRTTEGNRNPHFPPPLGRKDRIGVETFSHVDRDHVCLRVLGRSPTPSIFLSDNFRSRGGVKVKRAP